MLMGAAEPAQPPPPPPVTEELMGKVAPPVEHVKMGEAMPEVKEPCDPQPGFAAPPPPLQMGQAVVPVVAPPPPPTLMGGAVPVAAPPPPPQPALMGDIAVAPEPPPPPVEPSHVRMGRRAPKAGEPEPLGSMTERAPPAVRRAACHRCTSLDQPPCDEVLLDSRLLARDPPQRARPEGRPAAAPRAARPSAASSASSGWRTEPLLRRSC